MHVGMGATGLGIIGMTMLFLAVLFYFLPTIIVLKNEHHNNKAGVIIINIIFGVSLIGWIIALIWACQKSYPYTPQAQVVNVNNVVPGSGAAGRHSPQVPAEPVHTPAPVVETVKPALPDARRWKIQLFQDGQFHREFPLGATPLTIGRSGAADVQLNDERVSGSHWRVSGSADGVVVEDLDTTNGTWKRGNQKVARDVGSEGDWYQVGGIQMLVCSADG